MKELNADPLGPVIVSDNEENELEAAASMDVRDAEEISQSLTTLRAEIQVFVFDAEDLDFGAGAVEPAYGWKIERANGELFAVVSGGDGIPPFRYVTNSRKRLIVYTSKIAG